MDQIDHSLGFFLEEIDHSLLAISTWLKKSHIIAILAPKNKK